MILVLIFVSLSLCLLDHGLAQNADSVRKPFISSALISSFFSCFFSITSLLNTWENEYIKVFEQRLPETPISKQFDLPYPALESVPESDLSMVNTASFLVN